MMWSADVTPSSKWIYTHKHKYTHMYYESKGKKRIKQSSMFLRISLEDMLTFSGYMVYHIVMVLLIGF